MKMILRSLCLLGVVGSFLRAQPPPPPGGDRPERPGPPESLRDRPRHGMEEGEEGARRPYRGGGDPAVMVERYLSQLEKVNAEEARRLRELREKDPEAFRQELRRKFQDFRERGGPPPMLDRPRPLREELRAVREAQTPEAREEALADLRLKVAARIDEQLAHREEAIRDFREKLKDLEERNADERERRAEIIEAHLQRLLEEPEAPDA